MNCHTLTDAIVDRARGVDVGPGSAAAVESHLGQCPACAARFERERALTAGLRALASRTAGQVPSDAFGRRLLEQFAEQQFVASGVTSEPTRGLRGSPRKKWMQAAAMIIVGVGVLAVWRTVSPGRSPETDTTRRPAGAARPMAPAGPVQASAPPVERPTTPVAVRSGGSAGRNSLRGPTSGVIRPVGFVPLPGAASLPAFESGQIVRMELPLTSMPFYGVDIPPDARDKPVQADLLVGQDGQARAIRLVISTANTRTGGP